MANQRDYYSILQVNRNASQDDIQRAYERLSQAFDPATSRKPRAAQRHAEVQQAYEVLGDRDKRREYDRSARRGDREVAGSLRPSDVLSNRFILVAAGTLIASIVAIIGVVVLFGGGGDDESVLATSTPAPTPTVAPTAQPQTPGVPPETPPEVTGEEVVLESGLRYIEILVGAGEEAKTGDTVAVNYTGWLEETGAMFDSSVDETSAFLVQLGTGAVIQGWEQGLPGMREGGTRRLIIPPDLAYGEVGSGDAIPPNATLIFDIKLEDVVVSPAATPTPAATAGPTVPAQTAGTPPESPPEVTGEEIEGTNGLVYIDFQTGSTDEVLEFGDQIVVNYTGWLQSTGVMFDSSVDGTTPYRLTLGIGNVIPGWDQGLVGLGVGGKRRLIIPPELAYGAAGSGDIIPPNSTLVFDVELVDILVKGAVTTTPAP